MSQENLVRAGNRESRRKFFGAIALVLTAAASVSSAARFLFRKGRGRASSLNVTPLPSSVPRKSQAL